MKEQQALKQEQKNYQNVHRISRHARVLNGITSVLDWDQETHMPKGGAEIRAAQLEALAGVIHKERTGKPFIRALSKLIDIPTGHMLAKGLTAPQMAAVKQWRHDLIKDMALPKKFVEEFAKTTSQGVICWREAKNNNDFSQFAPLLEKIVALCRKKADLLGFEEHPYDALLDIYEPQMTSRKIGELFAPLKTSVVGLLKDITQAEPIDDRFLNGSFDHEKQLDFGRRLLTSMGYDQDHGRLDLSAHPFSSAAHPSDSRVTTRIHPTSVISNIGIILHEGGHALYEMGLPQEEYGTPLGDALSLGMHESQSRWWETRIGQSLPFWQYYLPLLKEQFPNKFDEIDVETFYRAVNKVEPSLIRVEADEVTYPLHVILRFELERALIEGSLSVQDIPQAWNSKMKELLQIVPSNDAEGCLQDVHWSMGGFGYFPAYTLGNFYAAHLFDAFAKEHPQWQKLVASGSFKFIKQWLHQAVFQHGRRYASTELLEVATGKPFSAKSYIGYLLEKYGQVYRLTAARV